MTLSIKTGVLLSIDGLAHVNKLLTRTSTGDSYQVLKKNVGTSEETFTIDADIGSVREVAIVNTDDTNFVDIGLTTSGQYGIRIDPGEAVLLTMVPTIGTIYCKADTAACEVLFVAVEE